MRRILKWGCGALIVLVVLGGIFVVMGGGGDTDTDTAQRSSSEGEVEADVDATPRPIAPTYAEMGADLDGKTDAQRNSYLKALQGQRVEDWTGVVCNVTETFGSYYVEVSMDADTEGGDLLGCTNEIRWRVNEEQALDYNAGDVVTVSGVIDDITSVGSAFGFRLTEVDVTR